MKTHMKFRTLLLLIPLGACAQQDPFDRPRTWSVPEGTAGANDANLRTMIVDPRDLAAGSGEENSAASEAATPVRRLLSGRRAPLPQANASSIGAGSTNSPTAGNAQPQ
jgi:hypothetical protein